MKISPLGRGGTPLGQKKGGTQRPQQDHCHRAMGDAVFVSKKGGLNVHNEGIAAWAKRDTAQMTKKGTQWPHQNYCRRAMGDAAFAPKNEGLNVHNDSITARAKGDAAWATNLGDSTSITELSLLGDGK
jgi:hypothetical protein